MTEKITIGNIERHILDKRMRVYESVFKIIGNNPNIEKIIPAEDFELPKFKDINFQRLISEYYNETMLKKRIVNIYRSIYSPYIVDKFANSRDRDNWRTSLDKDAFEATNNNALRPQKFIGVRNIVDAIQRRGGVGQHGDWEKQFHYLANNIISKATSDNLDVYISLSKNEQVDYAKDFKGATASLLKHLGTN